MWFKNIRLYCLTESFELSPEDLESRLTELAFRPCSSHDKSTMGWVSPLGDQGEMLTHAVGNYIMLCARKQERLLPASVVRDATEEKVSELEQRQQRKIFRKEKREIQDDVYATMLPRAFTRNHRIFAYIAVKENLLVVDSASAPSAEELLGLLRATLGSLKVALPMAIRSPGDVMTRWLQQHKASDNFDIAEDCELYNPLDGSNVVRCKGQDLSSEEIQANLEAGKQVKNLGVTWNSLLACNIADDLTVKRLRFDTVREENGTGEEESPAQKFDQDFALMTLELAEFFKALFKAFGGLEDPKKMERQE